MELSDRVNDIAAALKAQVPGLTIHVHYDTERAALTLVGRYACPCGEISGFSQAFYEDDTYLPPVELLVGRLKHILREHVRGEGNDPSF